MKTINGLLFFIVSIFIFVFIPFLCGTRIEDFVEEAFVCFLGFSFYFLFGINFIAEAEKTEKNKEVLKFLGFCSFLGATLFIIGLFI